MSQYMREMDEFFKGFADHFKGMQYTSCKKSCCCKEEEDEKLDENKESLIKDLNDCMNWAFGNGSISCDKEAAIGIWKRLHGDAAIPRYLLSEEYISQSEAHIMLLVDIIPLWLESKKTDKTPQ